MSTTTYHSALEGYETTASRTSVFSNFINWCAGQEKNRLLWMGIALGGQGCVLFPFSMLASLLAGTNPVLMAMAIVSIVMTVIFNLAAQPTKVTIPLFFLGILIDVAVIVAACSIGLNFSKLF